MLLVQFDHNWADEFNVHGLAIMTQLQYDYLLLWAKNATYNFGTNEGWEEEDLTSGFSIVTTDTDEVDAIKMILSFYAFGPYLIWGNFPEPSEYEDFEI